MAQPPPSSAPSPGAPNPSAPSPGAPRRSADDYHLGEMPPPRPHRPSENPEERSPDGHRRDVFASLGSGVLVIAGTALLAWLLYSLLG